jgi:hypothetical protein
MHTIDITTLKGKTEEMILQSLAAAGPSFYKIVLPKTSSIEEGQFAILEDFMMADHFSNRLRQNAYDVLFSLPEPGKTGTFSFVALTEDLKEMACLLALYANGFEGSKPGLGLAWLIGDETADMKTARHNWYYYTACANLSEPNPDYSMNAYCE